MFFNRSFFKSSPDIDLPRKSSSDTMQDKQCVSTVQLKGNNTTKLVKLCAIIKPDGPS